MPAPRHLLIVASQSRGMRTLKRLGPVATELDAVLRDPSLGGFEGGLPDGRSLLLDPPKVKTMQDAIDAAVTYAAEREAVLCFGFLGHGFIMGGDPTMYFMGEDSADQRPGSAINVGDVLFTAADTAGVAGVLAVIDTCHAVAGMPPIGRLNLGKRAGFMSVAALCATGALTDAYNLDLSAELTRLLRDGLPDRPAQLEVTHLSAELVERISQQRVTPVLIGYAPHMWLGLNRADRVAPPRTSIGQQALNAALARWDAGYPLTPVEDTAGLRALRGKAEAGPPTPARLRVLQVLDCLDVAHRSAEFVRSWDIGLVTSQAVRRTLAQVTTAAAPPDSAELADITSALEHVALTFPPADRTCRRHVVRFVWTLRYESGAEPDPEDVIRWKADISADLVVHDEQQRLERLAREHRLRLVAVLYPGLPLEADCWLLDAERRVGQQLFACTGTPEGYEAALAQALEWAEREARRQGLDLNRLEVAAPAELLPSWQPELAKIDNQLLGLNYDVRMHWNERLLPDRVGGNNRIRRRMSRSMVDGAERVTWLTAEQMGDLAAVQEIVQYGQHASALGLAHRPSPELLLLLLPVLGIVIWPPDGLAGEGYSAAVEHQWARLPGAFIEEYRTRWRTPELARPVSHLRAVWDDEEWFAFSDLFHRGKTAS